MITLRYPPVPAVITVAQQLEAFDRAWSPARADEEDARQSLRRCIELGYATYDPVRDGLRLTPEGERVIRVDTHHGRNVARALIAPGARQ